ncbi:pantetheine-phosphate adenylyltransferase [Nanoarchaeota archaeon]
MKTAIYAGTFDPITMGHVDIVKRALKIFDKVIIGISTHFDKKALFSLEERKSMVVESIKGVKGIEVETFSGLLIDFAKKKQCNVLIKGLRAVSDFEMEFQQALTNRKMNKDIETVFIMTSQENVFLSSSLVKEIARNGGKIDQFVPKVVADNLQRVLKEGLL